MIIIAGFSFFAKIFMYYVPASNSVNLNFATLVLLLLNPV